MKNKFYIPSAVLLALITLPTTFAQTHDQTSTAPDNTGVNKRDRSMDAKTADHQAKGTQSDTDVTRMIRRELTKNDSLSTYAKNVKIVTNADSVTLRGPVNTMDEKTKIGAVAEQVATNRTIHNELEVKQQAQKVQN